MICFWHTLKESWCFFLEKFDRILRGPHVLFLNEFETIFDVSSILFLTEFERVLRTLVFCSWKNLIESWEPVMFYFWKEENEQILGTHVLLWQNFKSSWYLIFARISSTHNVLFLAEFERVLAALVFRFWKNLIESWGPWGSISGKERTNLEDT